MSQQLTPIGTYAGIAGGIICTVGVNINSGDLIKTVILATIGAVASVLVSLLLKRLLNRWRRW